MITLPEKEPTKPGSGTTSGNGCWGNLLYDPSTTDSFFERQLERRYGGGLGKPLLNAWKLASKTPLRFASFYRGQNDLSLYTEGHVSRGERESPSFIDVDRLITRPVLDSRRYVNIREWVQKKETLEPGQISPLDLADQLVKDGLESMESVAAVRRRGNISPTLEAELTDIECWYWYARFFAQQLRGGVYLERFREHGHPEDQQLAINQLRTGASYWWELSNTIRKYNQEELPFYAGIPFSWIKYLPMAEADADIAREAVPRKR